MKRKLAASRAKPQTPRKRAFTLIELLVVIALIAILAAMLLPALSKAKAQALSTACKNHLHEMGLALQMYVDEQKIYPYLSGDPGRNSMCWADALQPYYKLNWTNQSFHCPAYRGMIVNNHGDGNVYGSYSYNSTGVGVFPADGPIRFLGLGFDKAVITDESPIRDAQVLVPSDMIAIMDALGGLEWFQTGWFGSYQTHGALRPFVTTGSLHSVQSPPQHGKFFNVVFCDAHVQPMQIADLFNPTNMASSWNNDHQSHPESWIPQ